MDSGFQNLLICLLCTTLCVVLFVSQISKQFNERRVIYDPEPIEMVRIE